MERKRVARAALTSGDENLVAMPARGGGYDDSIDFYESMDSYNVDPSIMLRPTGGGGEEFGGFGGLDDAAVKPGLPGWVVPAAVVAGLLIFGKPLLKLLKG